MSTLKTLVEQAIRQKRLVERPSSFTGDETVRTLIVAPEIAAVTSEPFADTIEGERLGEAAATLDAFSEGGAFSVAENPKAKPPETMLSRVDPVREDFWSIRITDPEDTPGIRILGAFYDQDKFVALTWHRREEMVDFDDDVAATREAWRDLFGSEPPLHGSNLDAYLTNYYLA